MDIKKAVIETINNQSEFLSQNDSFFLDRIFSEGLEKYKDRLKAISFTGSQRVLDAGCGYGQWSLALADLNENVISCDPSANRINFLNDLIQTLSIKNLSTNVSGINSLPYDSESFDLIFCYQVLHYTPWKTALSEFSRILKPGGKLYLTTNDIGWYLYTWYVAHNSADDYNPKEIAAKSFLQTYLYEEEGQVSSDMSLIIRPSLLISEIKELGFEKIETANEGSLKSNQWTEDPKPFFCQNYKEFQTVYEVLAHKIK